MTQIAIHDKVAGDLAAAAAGRGCSQEDLASALLEDGLRREDEFELTPEQETRLMKSIHQAQRGELINGEMVMARFERALQEIASK